MTSVRGYYGGTASGKIGAHLRRMKEEEEEENGKEVDGEEEERRRRRQRKFKAFSVFLCKYFVQSEGKQARR